MLDSFSVATSSFWPKFWCTVRVSTSSNVSYFLPVVNVVQNFAILFRLLWSARWCGTKALTLTTTPTTTIKIKRKIWKLLLFISSILIISHWWILGKSVYYLDVFSLCCWPRILIVVSWMLFTLCEMKFVVFIFWALLCNAKLNIYPHKTKSQRILCNIRIENHMRRHSTHITQHTTTQWFCLCIHTVLCFRIRIQTN